MVRKVLIFLDDSDHDLLSEYKESRGYTWADMLLCHVNKAVGDNRFKDKKVIE